MERMKGEIIMKKLIILLFATLLVAGCDIFEESTPVGSESKSCSYLVNNDIRVTYKLESYDNIINKIDVVEELPSDVLDEEGLAKLSNEDKNLIKKVALLELGVDDSEHITISFEVKDGIVVSTLTFDLTKLTDFDLEKLGIGSSNKMSKVLEAFENAGIPCE